MKVTVGIKALNEERHIDKSLASAVTAVRPFGGEVVLADSGSTDKTIEIARRHPVRIVQLANPDERSCGAGAQLAFQHAQGEYFYLLDGDMEIDPGFLPAGIAYLEANPQVAGVGGRVNEMNVDNQDFQIRAANSGGGHWAPGEVDRLDCGGLYRSAAIWQSGYFADRNLHAFEEFELGARLRARGWKLARIDQAAVDHHGHTTEGYRLLMRRVRSGYAGAPGEVLRGALGHDHLGIVLGRLGHIRNGVVVISWWIVLLLSLLSGHWLVALILLLAPLLFLTIRRKSLGLGLYSLASWNVSAWGLLSGLLRKRVAATQALDSIELQ